MLDYDYKRKTKKIKTETTYPDGANAATYITTYECFCGKGKIVEEVTPGFDDSFVTIECKHCLKKYHEFIDYCGNEWKVYLRKNNK